VMASNKLIILQEIQPQRFEEARAKRLTTGNDTVPGAAAAPAADAGITLADVFAGIAAYVAREPALVDKTKTSFQFHFRNPDSSWFIDLKSGKGSAGAGSLDKADVTLELDAEHVETLFGGDLAKVQKLFFGGQLKISGNVMASNKLTVLSGMDKQLVEEARQQRIAAGGAAPVAAAASPAREAQAPAIFAALKARLAKEGRVAGLDKIVQFHVRDPEACWTVDFSVAPPAITGGDSANAATKLGIADADLAALAKGEAEARDLYQHGKLRVDGDVAPAHALGIFKGLL
ncbi:MAG TPA: SCP2 sterol-binding domain-containing protein, partial [Moraxellaceae bacterium]|nr:SCP2 sterol-binding domain-containing protein [Moraxellaceae bacterium]